MTGCVLVESRTCDNDSRGSAQIISAASYVDWPLYSAVRVALDAKRCSLFRISRI